MKKAWQIFLQSIPILFMIGLIPLVENDYWLTFLYCAIIVLSFSLYREKNDIRVFCFGFCVMIVSEYIFVSTGVETFQRNTLFGLMPLWLPFLWGYSFVAMKRAIRLLSL